MNKCCKREVERVLVNALIRLYGDNSSYNDSDSIDWAVRPEIRKKLKWLKRCLAQKDEEEVKDKGIVGEIRRLAGDYHCEVKCRRRKKFPNEDLFCPTVCHRRELVGQIVKAIKKHPAGWTPKRRKTSGEKKRKR